MPDCPFNQPQEEWLFSIFMRKRGAQIWLGIITILFTAFVVSSGITMRAADKATSAAQAVADSLHNKSLVQARREGKVDATLESIDKTLGRIETYMTTHP